MPEDIVAIGKGECDGAHGIVVQVDAGIEGNEANWWTKVGAGPMVEVP